MSKKVLMIAIAVLMISMPAMADINFHAHFNLTGTTAGAGAAATPGSIQVTGTNTDAFSQFTGTGGNITGDCWINSQNPYLDTDVDASGTNGAVLNFNAFQNLSGFTNNTVVVSAGATGATTSDMNLRFDNSNYVVQLERHDTGKDLLGASGTDYGVAYAMNIVDKTSGSSSAGVAVSINDVGSTGGSASLDTNQWHSTATGSYGWGNPDNINAPDPPGYYTPTNTVGGSGSGTLNISAFGNNFLSTSTNINMPEGGTYGGGVWNFNNTISGNYAVTAN